MKISIFGLGYVGCVSAGCLAKLGHSVIGVDVSENKVQLINQGRATIIEKDIDGLIAEAVGSGKLQATNDAAKAVLGTELSIISVGTPSSKNGHLNLEFIFHVSEEIGAALKGKSGFHVVAVRSTVLPGTNEKVAAVIEKSSGKKRNRDFSVVSNPEFLREGTAVQDYFNPPLTLIGTNDERARERMLELYREIPGEKISTDIKVAEIMKYVNNTYHALKVVFGNEVGNICKSLDIDSHKVMDIFCKDKQLNISSYYFKPGFAYGGSCLPKDTKALKTLAGDLYVPAPVINAIEQSNELQKENALNVIIAQGERKITILGLSFKAGTDDLRNSAIVDIVERLLGKGYEVCIYDKNVKISQLTGTNKDFIEAKIPHLQKYITDNLDVAMEFASVVVISNKEKEFEAIPRQYRGKRIVDLVRMWNSIEYEGMYEGLSWNSINASNGGSPDAE